MSDAPRLNTDKVVEKAKQKAKSGIPWLESFDCPECGAQCKASHCYDSQEAAFYGHSNGERPSWYCSECEKHYRRESDSGFSLSPFR